MTSRFEIIPGLAESIAAAIQAELTAKIDFEGPITTSTEEDEEAPFIADTSGFILVNPILHTATFEIKVQQLGSPFSRILKVQIVDEGKTVEA